MAHRLVGSYFLLALLNTGCVAETQLAILAPLNSSRIALSHPLTSTEIPLRYHCLDVMATACLQVTQKNFGIVLDRTCLSCSQNDHMLSNLGIGKYEISIDIVSAQNESSNYVQFFDIVSIEEGLPRVHLPQTEIELLASPPKYSRDISFQYVLLDAATNVVKQIEICVEMINTLTGVVALPNSCVRSDHNSLSLNSVAEGDYRVSFRIRLAYAPFTVFTATEQFLTVQIHRQTEFVPSYQWQRVREWESVPSGLEIRLPIGAEGGRKMAKIPEPWRMQLALPSPCKYFLRMDIYQHTSAADILNGASNSCKLPVDCFAIFIQDQEISIDERSTATSLVLDFFKNAPSIEVLPGCYITSSEKAD